MTRTSLVSYLKWTTKLSIFCGCLVAGYASSLVFWSPSEGYGADQEDESIDVDEKVTEPVVAVETPALQIKKVEPIDEGPTPKVGILASTMPAAGYGHQVSTATDTEASGGAPSGITGGLSRTGKNWSVSITNNSKVTYSVTAKVEQINNQGRVAKTDTLTYTLKAGESAERQVPASINANGGSLYLVSFRKLGGAKTSMPAPESE